jgi:hypothetical protein
MKIKTSLILIIALSLGIMACGDIKQPNLDDFERQTIGPDLPTMPHRSALVHAVYFNLKDDISDADEQRFLEELKRLADVPSADYVEAGPPAASGDPRMDSTFDMALQVGFPDLEALAKYQADSLHLDVKSKVGRFLAGPPVVYDFFSK